MFGYVRPYKSEMLVREYEQYKAVYCELCRVLGKEYGVLARLSLSYDLTFYALLALCVTGAKLQQQDKRCVVNPLKKCTYLASPGEEYRKAAAFSVLLTQEKLKDDRSDEGFLKATGCRLLLALVRRKAKKAGERYPALKKLAEDFTAAQQEAEQAQAGPDACAEPTANLLKCAFRELAGCDEMQGAALGQFGYFLGRWVYLMDAADDLEKDLKQGSFNPFIKRLALEPGQPLREEKKQETALYCNEALNANVAQMILPLNLLELENFGPIIENVIKKGLPEVQREILFLRVHDKRKQRGNKL